MNSRSLKYLVAATAALILLLVATEYAGDEAESVDDRLFPELRDRINAATTIRIVRTESDDEIVIRKTDDNWVSTSRSDYPVDIGRIRELLLALADAKLVEQKTARPENYAQLGVDDPANEGSKATRLTIAGDGGNEIDLILGNVAQPGYRYARKFDAAQSWLIDKDPTLPATAADWLLKDVVDVKPGAVRAVTISHPDGERIHIGKESAEQTDFDVADIPDGRELSYPTVANGIAGVLSALKFDDVRAGGEFGDDAVTTTFETFDGDRIEVRSLAEDGADWITLRASSEDGDGELAAAINARTEDWQYRIASYKANQLTRRWDDILAAPPEADDAEE